MTTSRISNPVAERITAIPLEEATPADETLPRDSIRTCFSSCRASWAGMGFLPADVSIVASAANSSVVAPIWITPKD